MTKRGIQDIAEFHRQFAALDLGPLECWRDFVALHSIDNALDVLSSDAIRCAIATAQMYVDDPEMAEVFHSYKPND